MNIFTALIDKAGTILMKLNTESVSIDQKKFKIFGQKTNLGHQIIYFREISLSQNIPEP
jgi:hypothetical protein